MSKRPPAVAGMFYEADAQRLGENIDSLLERAQNRQPSGNLKALIVPHAGYMYSGIVAAHAYRLLREQQFRRVLLLGPSHRVPFHGIAASSADTFITPLGEIPVDQALNHQLVEQGLAQWLDTAHEQEHSLEVQLPFLQRVLPTFELVPLTVGSATPEQVAAVIESVSNDPRTLVLISTDLSHFHDYQTANSIDDETTARIEQQDYQHIDYDQACGATPLKGMLRFSSSKQWHVTTLDRRNSGDTGGDKQRVVGYGAWAITA